LSGDHPGKNFKPVQHACAFVLESSAIVGNQISQKLGWVQPFIEELNFPLARHCSHGKTGVLVNGRELHHEDLERLKKRGLPGTPGKAYNVDIDGRLTEETTGIELKGLGRLAPTYAP